MTFGFGCCSVLYGVGSVQFRFLHIFFTFGLGSWQNLALGLPLFYWQKIQDFSTSFRDAMKNFPGPFRSPQMFKYKEKTAFTYNIQSVVHCRKFPFELLEKCMTFKDIFPGLSRTKVIFQDFPGGVGTLWLLVWFILAEFGLLPISIIYWQCTCAPLPSPHLTGHEDDGLYKNLCQIAVTASRYFQMWKGRLTPYKPSTSSKAELLPQNWTCRATNKQTHTQTNPQT